MQISKQHYLKRSTNGRSSTNEDLLFVEDTSSALQTKKSAHKADFFGRITSVASPPDLPENVSPPTFQWAHLSPATYRIDAPDELEDIKYSQDIICKYIQYDVDIHLV